MGSCKSKENKKKPIGEYNRKTISTCFRIIIAEFHLYFLLIDTKKAVLIDTKIAAKTAEPIKQPAPAPTSKYVAACACYGHHEVGDYGSSGGDGGGCSSGGHGHSGSDD